MALVVSYEQEELLPRTFGKLMNLAERYSIGVMQTTEPGVTRSLCHPACQLLVGAQCCLPNFN